MKPKGRGNRMDKINVSKQQIYNITRFLVSSTNKTVSLALPSHAACMHDEKQVKVIPISRLK